MPSIAFPAVAAPCVASVTATVAARPRASVAARELVSAAAACGVVAADAARVAVPIPAPPATSGPVLSTPPVAAPAPSLRIALVAASVVLAVGGRRVASASVAGRRVAFVVGRLVVAADGVPDAGVLVGALRDGRARPAWLKVSGPDWMPARLASVSTWIARDSTYVRQAPEAPNRR
ncbi:hypothetical protein GCM10010411_66910 [Actinomadura fulvescens]|uniref:Secreted protein n=1 Tax=Actinomadura fulvescens TaxID=46160 RepID=A0ABN3QAZ9_9ACTN